ncbi:MAG: succinate dehydrogenase, hydrophobic membrane anchor protein [Pseudomonadota bacterium]
MSYNTDLKRVVGLGSAKEGTGHFWSQRVTAVALIPLLILAILPFDHSLGTSWEAVRATYSHPFNAIIAILTIAVLFRHLQLGVQVVIEDYVHSKGVRAAALLANTLLCALFGLTGVFAVAKIAFAG